MLMIKKYFLILVISVAASIICERTWSQVTYETCTIQDSYVTSVVPHCRVISLFRLQFVQSLAVVALLFVQSLAVVALFRIHTQKKSPCP